MMTIFVVFCIVIAILMLLCILGRLVFDIVSTMSMISYIIGTGLLRGLIIAVIVIGTILIAKKFYNKHFKKSEVH